MSPHAPAADAALADWLAYLETLHPKSIDLGLDRIREVAERLDFSLDAIKITVAGTNGKGSTCAMLDAILRQAGYRTGLYSSPHLIDFNERIRIQGVPASNAAIAAQLARIEAIRGDVSLTYFEMTTLAAFLLFAEAALDVVILEVGLGGRLDAVNLLDTDCAILTSVDLDHMAYLGNTREAIGGEKAHIFRTNTPAICADPVPPKSVLDYARDIDAHLWCFGKDFNYSGDRQQWAYGGRSRRRHALPYPALRGANQLLNASAALAALDALHPRLVVSQQAVREGLLRVHLSGRMQIVPGVPAIVLDVAHNPHAAAALGQSLDAMGHFPKTFAVVGMLHDKNIAETLLRLLPRIDHWLCATLEGPRGTQAAELRELLENLLNKDHSVALPAQDALVADAQQVTRKPGVRPVAPAAATSRHVDVSTFNDPVAAFNQARQWARENDRILVFGSFATVGPVLHALQAEGRDLA